MKTLTSFSIGILLGVLFFSITASAGGGIKRAFFNNNKISYNGRELDLGGEQMVSIVPEGQNSAENYIPMRKALEEMGFKVEWDAKQNAVVISD